MSATCGKVEVAALADDDEDADFAIGVDSS
jgi:hypothetical protein